MNDKENTMSPDVSVDVLICGAGAAGLALALDLARRKVSFLLIDKAISSFEGSRGRIIQPRTQEIFEDLGVLDRMVSKGGRLPPLRTYSAGSYEDSVVIAPEVATSAEPYVEPLVLPQNLTERILRERLAEFGYSVNFSHELVAFDQTVDGVAATCRLADRELQIGAKFLVGADGARSFVRQTLAIGFPGESLPNRALVADLSIEGLSSDVWHLWNAGSSLQISLCALAGTDFFRLQAVLPLDGDVDLSQAGLTEMIAERTGRNDIAVHDVFWSSAYGMHARLAERYRVSRTILVGDAAHIHPPTGGQGLNTGIQDALNLGWKLAMTIEGAPPHVLDSYEDERRPVAASVLDLSKSLLRKATANGDIRRGRETLQLDLGYRQSVLSLNALDRRCRLSAGDRAPDATYRADCGQRTRLFDLFQGPHWTLLCYGPSHDGLPSSHNRLIVQVAGEDDSDIKDNYDLEPGDCVLVRPDGYIAALVAENRRAPLYRMLADLGLAAHRS